jgi:hypothetical protein
MIVRSAGGAGLLLLIHADSKTSDSSTTALRMDFSFRNE